MFLENLHKIAKSSWPSAEARTTLREWRDTSTRRSDETVELWEHVLSRRPQQLDDELWVVYEQVRNCFPVVFLVIFRRFHLTLQKVCIAALDCGRQDVANLCIEALLRKFGETSLRISKLRAMRFEAMYKYDDAMTLYDQLVETEPTNTVIDWLIDLLTDRMIDWLIQTYRKRRVAVLIAQNKTDEAIDMLNDYLQVGNFDWFTHSII